MTLIVEDGSGVVNANAYVSVSAYRVWATARGLTLPSDDTDGNLKIEQAIIKATDYLEISKCWQGEKADDTYSLSWPRKCVFIKGKPFADDAIPKQIVNASYYLASAVLAGVELMPNVSGNAVDYVVKEKVGPIETTYASGSQFNGQTTFTAVEALLEGLLGTQCGGFGRFTVYRG